MNSINYDSTIQKGRMTNLDRGVTARRGTTGASRQHCEQGGRRRDGHRRCERRGGQRRGDALRAMDGGILRLRTWGLGRRQEFESFEI